MREESGRAAEFLGVVSTVDRVEPSLGAGTTVLGRTVAGVELRVAIRSAKGRRTAEFRSETLGEGLRVVGSDEAPAPIRLPISRVAFEPALLLWDERKDLLLKELPVCGVIVLPIERSFIEGVRFICDGVIDGCLGVNVYVLFE